MHLLIAVNLYQSFLRHHLCVQIGKWYSAIDYLKLFTLLNPEEIKAIERQHLEAPHLRIAQKTLAREVTALIHGEDRVAAIEKVNSVLFGGVNVSELSASELEILAGEIPTVQAPTNVISALTTTEIAKSAGEAKRLIAGNAISINGQKISENAEISTTSLIKKGKNNFILVK